MKNKVVNNVWLERSSSDFLKYLKFEFMQYSFFGSMMFGSLVNSPQFNKMLIC